MNWSRLWEEDKVSAVLFGVCLMLNAMALALLPLAIWESIK